MPRGSAGKGIGMQLSGVAMHVRGCSSPPHPAPGPGKVAAARSVRAVGDTPHPATAAPVGGRGQRLERVPGGAVGLAAPVGAGGGGLWVPLLVLTVCGQL